ncbi:TraR/DksA C4-type zinc finger protein [Nocardioides sp. TF02-7]|uniref:TraR/DksA family transcriptional regulator n=1 Tax=Nocardioides sp. TF02-7 TaxID=2917724 RepID=UPI001F053011|nr:TraR/DksA C4-type zinc finger protein [Nocardioides sp. TF02-7]UMG92752.1 TraR/DksA C4-type zinc finger protein [Nocardioides sp. TF02-7]
MTSTATTARRTFPTTIRADLEAAQEARLRQLEQLPHADPADLVASAHRNSVARILREVVEALERLDDGSYGDCLSCHRPIELARLVQRPWAVYCAGCVNR